ncbi:MAG: hypothetical protein IPL39_15660 [Opitutaceae bacterium]|nr:hypothetical protein [Opitutaceae bacterium]
MSAQIRNIVWKVFTAVFFLILAAEVSTAPVGHLDEPHGSKSAAPLLILLCGIIVLVGKWKKLHVHLAWSCFCLTVFLGTYRHYCYHKMNDEMQQKEIFQLSAEIRAIRTREETPNQRPEANAGKEPVSPTTPGPGVAHP